MITIILYGRPQAQKRPRFKRVGIRKYDYEIGSFVRTYNPDYKAHQKIRQEIMQQYQDKPLTGPLKVKFTFLFAPPMASMKKTQAMLDGRIYKTTKPDTSNMIKLYEDLMNKIVYKDDAQIVYEKGFKKYALEEKTIIEITEL